MSKLISIWNFICRRKYLITIVAFAVIIGFLDENSLVRRLGYEREISQLKEEIEKYRTDYEENTKRLNEISTNPDAIEQIAAVFITGWAYAPYIYTVGAGFIALAQVNTPIKGKSKTLKRLRIQQIFGALALILTGAFMFTTRGNEWIACLTIAAILELYTAFRIPQEEEKEKAN